MNKNQSPQQQLGDVIAHLERYPQIRSAAPVEAEPLRRLCIWQVFKVVKANGQEDRYGLHFLGLDVNDFTGAVSTRIETFHPATMRGVTISGRIYELVGGPGFSANSIYALHHWCQVNKVEIEGATIDFMAHYDIAQQNDTPSPE